MDEIAILSDIHTRTEETLAQLRKLQAQGSNVDHIKGVFIEVSHWVRVRIADLKRDAAQAGATKQQS